MTTIIAVVVAVLLSLLAADVEAWLSWASSRLIRCEASKLPRLSERMQEQWLADLAEIPGNVAKLCFAVSLVLRHLSIVSSLPVDEAEDVEHVIVPAVGTSAGTSTALGASAGSLSLTGNTPTVFISHHDSSLSATSGRLTIIDVDDLQPSNLSRLMGSSGSGTNSETDK